MSDAIEFENSGLETAGESLSGQSTSQERQVIALIVTLIRTLEKAKKIVRTYPSNNQTYKNAILDTHGKFSEYFALSCEEELVLQIEHNAILYKSTKVYSNDDLTDNLALFFFKDGVQTLIFEKNISTVELESFIKILGTDYTDDDTDVIGLLWERDFENIKYVTVEDLSFEDTNYEQKVFQAVNNNSDILRAYEEALNQPEHKEIQLATPSEDDVQLLLDEAQEAFNKKKEKLAEILFYTLMDATDPEEIQTIAEATMNLTIDFLNHKVLNGFLKMSSMIAELRLRSDMSTAVNLKLGWLHSFCISGETISRLGDIIDSEDIIDESILSKYVDCLDANSLRPFMALLDRLKTIRGRKRVVAILSKVGKKDVALIVEGLRDPRWYFVRNILCVLGQMNDQATGKNIVPMLRHSNARVRVEAIRALETLSLAEDTNLFHALHEIIKCLDDEDLMVRLSTLKTVSNLLMSHGSTHEDVRATVISKATTGDFLKLGMPEKKAYCDLLSRWNEAKVNEFMMRLLKKRFFLNRIGHIDNKIVAAYYFGLTGNKEVVQVLRQLKDSPHMLLRNEVEAALRKIESENV
ncbi:MAG: HEAT repeat domain-containing protein [Dissulfurispiraceae bacterium]